MDAGLQIKELASIVGATEDSVINWELRGVRPSQLHLRRVIDFIFQQSEGNVTRKELVKLLFRDDPTYPPEAKTLGDKIRALRMENPLSIKQLAQQLGVNECTVAAWELGRSQPSSEKLERVLAFIESSFGVVEGSG